MANATTEAPPAMAEVLAAAQHHKERMVSMLPEPRMIASTESRVQEVEDRNEAARGLTLDGIDGTCIEAGVPAGDQYLNHHDLAETVLMDTVVHLDLNGSVTRVSPERYRLRWDGTTA